MIKTSHNNILDIGLDTITIDIKSNKRLKNNSCIFYNDITGNSIGKLIHKQGQEQGYRLIINLPKCLHNTNIKPYAVTDPEQLNETLNMITDKIHNLFGEEYTDLIVRTCEVNATAKLNNPKHVPPLLSMISYMLLSGGGKICMHVHGKKAGNRYDNVDSLPSGQEIESIKTPLLSNRRMSMKIYNKSLEQKIEDKDLIRFEIVYNRYGLDYAKAGQTLEDFLTSQSIINIINLYKYDYKKYFIDRYWNNAGHPFYKDCINLLYNDLVSYRCLKTVALINRVIVEWDWKLLEKACYKYYRKNHKKKNSATQALNRLKKSQEIEVNEKVISEFVQISKQICYG